MILLDKAAQVVGQIGRSLFGHRGQDPMAKLALDRSGLLTAATG